MNRRTQPSMIPRWWIAIPLGWLALLIGSFALDAHAQPTPTVVAPTTLNWTAPTAHGTGSSAPAGTPLAAGDLTGYALFFGQSRFSSGTTLRTGCTVRPASATSTACYANTRPVALGTTTTFDLTLTQSQTIYFALASLGRNGGIGDYSGEAPKQFTINVPVSPAPATGVTVTISVSVTCTTSDPNVGCTVTVN